MTRAMPHGLEFQFCLPSQQPPPDTYRCHQVHSSDVIVTEDTGKNREMIASIQADGLVSRVIGSSLGVQTADCIPALFYSKDVNGNLDAVGAIHAGWRGVLTGILPNTVGKFPSPQRLYAITGPSIQLCCFEVSTDLATDFQKSWEKTWKIFDYVPVHKKEKTTVIGHASQSHLWLDLQLIARAQLRAAGMPDENITSLGQCTYCTMTKHGSFIYASHRRATHLNAMGPASDKFKVPEKKRQISWIKRTA